MSWELIYLGLITINKKNEFLLQYSGYYAFLNFNYALLVRNLNYKFCAYVNVAVR